jgi:hypothetical protein
MPFWIKDAAYRTGLTPTLPVAQAFFHDARLDIERACREGRLKCRDKGSSLLPPFELRWVRAYVQEWFALLGMTLIPDIQTPEFIPGTRGVDVNYAHVYDVVTRASRFDAKIQSPGRGAQVTSRNSNASLGWQKRVITFYQSYGFILVIAGIMAFLIRLKLCGQIPPRAFVCFAAIWLAYTAVRLSALAYIAVYWGRFDARIIFSTYVVLLLLAPLLIADATSAIRKTRALSVKSI